MVALLTVYSPSWKELADITVTQMQKYCDKQGYELHDIRALDDSPLYYGWIKMQELYRLMFIDNEADIVWALDTDVLITNPEVRLEPMLDLEHDFYLTRDANGYNAGSMIFTKSNWTKDFLGAMWAESEHFPDNQNAIAYLLEQEEWQRRTFVLPQFRLNAYKVSEYPELDGRLNLGWRPSDLALHLPGLPMDRRIELARKIASV